MTEFERKFADGIFTHCIIEVDDDIKEEFDVSTSNLESLAFVLKCINNYVETLEFNQQRAFWINKGTYDDFLNAYEGE